MGFGIAPQLKAAEWSIVPSIGVKGVYNDNLLMTPLPHNETYGYWTSPTAEFAGKTERLEVSGKVAADFVSYYGGEETNFTNIFLPLSMRYKTEQDILGFTGGFTRDNTLMAELLETGLVLRFTQRNQVLANPTWARSLTEKLSLQTSFQLSDTTYEDGLRLGLVNYQLFGGSGGLLYQMTEQDQLQLTGSYVQFHTTNAPSAFQANLPGVSLSFTHTFTESLMATIFGGPRFISSTSQLGSDSITTRNTVWLFGGTIQKKFESATLLVSASRDIVPSGFGLLIQTDKLSTTASYDLNERFTVSLDASGYQISGASRLALGGSFSDQLFFYTTPKFSWKFSEWWRAELSYTYRWRDSIGIQPATFSNGAMFTITYYPPKLAFSN
jgi:hypothetical protein